MRRWWAGSLCLVALAGCGSSSDGPEAPEIGKARTFELVGLEDAELRAGRPADLAFHIEQPEGGPLTRYKTGSGPHTGVHLILAREDLGALVHRHPKVGADGTIRQELTLSAGRWRLVADAYPDLGASTIQNFQLTEDLEVGGARTPSRRLGAFEPVQTVDGVRFAMEDPGRLRALKPEFVEVDVRGRDGRPAEFGPYFGAIAHAIFFREGDLTYFHTHVCGEVAECTTGVSGKAAGDDVRPGRLNVGMVLPSPGTWRLFLQVRVDGRVITVPYTLRVQ